MGMSAWCSATEARHISDSCGAGVTDGCELASVGAGN